MIGISLRTRRRTRRSLLAATVACAAGLTGSDCSDGNEPPSGFGQYSLVSINDQALPFTIPDTQFGTVVVQSALLTLSSGTGGNSAYSASVLGTVNGQGQTLLADEGTYSRSGTNVTFTSMNPEVLPFTGTLVNDQLTVTLSGERLGTTGTFVLAFQK